jgi:hypothetical protein
MGAGGSWSGRCRCSGCRGWLSGLRPRRASGPAPMSGDLLIPARAAPSCVPELEIPGSAEPSRQAADPQNTVGGTSFRRPESRSVTVAEDGQAPRASRVARPGSADLSLYVVSRRLRSQTARSRHRQICTLTWLHLPVAGPDPHLYRCPMHCSGRDPSARVDACQERVGVCLCV